MTPLEYRRQRIAHWDNVARASVLRPGLGGYYHRRIAHIYRLVIPPGLRVLELGCGSGDLLAALAPSSGVGVDFSREMIELAQKRHPGMRFIEADAHELALEEKFDVIVLSDLINDLWDVQGVLERLRPMITPRTRIVLNYFSRLWEKPLNLARRVRLALPVLEQNWLAVKDVDNLLTLAGFEPIRTWGEIGWPVRTPIVDSVANRFLVKFWPLSHLAMTNFAVARPAGERAGRSPAVSVIVPARNEAGNIPAIFARTPEMGAGTELVFVEGHSRDNTHEAIEKQIAAHPSKRARLLKQTGTGKGDAVRLGFESASGDVLMILDADLTVSPEDLPRFYEALLAGRGEFINGVRLVYPMEKQAMQFLNLVANKLFGIAFSWLLGQSVKDTLCGTKVLWKEEYQGIARNRAYFGEFDPFGDFDLLFGAAKLDLKIIDLPVRYQERTYGSTNISRFRHGSLLFRMLLFAARRLKFV